MSLWGDRSFASLSHSCLMNRFPILTRNCAGRCDLKSNSCRRRLKTTALYVTHDQVEAMTLADRVVVLNKGRIEQVATPLELYSRPASLFVADFVGTYPMNFLRGTTSGADVDLASGARIASNTKITDPTSVVIGLRPEQLRIDPSGAIEFVPKIIEPLGSDTMNPWRSGRPAVLDASRSNTDRHARRKNSRLHQQPRCSCVRCEFREEALIPGIFPFFAEKDLEFVTRVGKRVYGQLCSRAAIQSRFDKRCLSNSTQAERC